MDRELELFSVFVVLMFASMGVLVVLDYIATNVLHVPPRDNNQYNPEHWECVQNETREALVDYKSFCVCNGLSGYDMVMCVAKYPNNYWLTETVDNKYGCITWAYGCNAKATQLGNAVVNETYCVKEQLVRSSNYKIMAVALPGPGRSL